MSDAHSQWHLAVLQWWWNSDYSTVQCHFFLFFFCQRTSLIHNAFKSLHFFLPSPFWATMHISSSQWNIKQSYDLIFSSKEDFSGYIFLHIIFGSFLRDQTSGDVFILGLFTAVVFDDLMLAWWSMRWVINAKDYQGSGNFIWLKLESAQSGRAVIGSEMKPAWISISWWKVENFQ